MLTFGRLDMVYRFMLPAKAFAEASRIRQTLFGD
jgi:hypothetical protein